MRATPIRMGAAEWALLLTLSLLWGGSFFFSKVAVAEIPPLTLAFFRVAIAAVALGLAAAAAGVAPPRGADWLPLAVMGALNNAVPFALIFWGQTTIASGLAAILNATAPLFTVVLAHLLTADERLTPARLAGVLAGVAGVAAMVGADALAGLGRELWAQLAVLAAAASYALAGIWGRRFRGAPPLAIAFGQLASAAVLLLPVAALVEAPWTLPPPSTSALAALAALALVSTALGYVVYFRILAAAGATNLLLVTFLLPPAAIALGVLVLGETLARRHALGLALIALGLAAIDGRAFAELRAPRAR